MAAATTANPFEGVKTGSAVTRSKLVPLGIAFFRMISENGLDVASLHSRDGRFMFVAPSVARTLGWTDEELLGKSLFDIVHGEDRSRVQLALAVEGDLTTRVTYRMLTPRGAFLWVETLAQASPSAGDRLVVCMTRDVTRTKRAALALEEGVLALSMQSPDGVLVIQDERVLHANAVAVEMFGRPDEAELAGTSYAELIDPVDAELELDALAHALATATVSPLHDVRLATAGAEGGLAVQAYHQPISFAGRDAALVVLRARPQPDTRAILADRLRSIGAITAGLAQELADPMALLMTSLEIMVDATQDTEAQQAAGTSAVQSARRVFDAVQSLRHFSRGDEDLRRAVDIRDVIDAVLCVATGSASATTRITRDFDTGVAPVHADRARLSQALLNLVLNAVDAANRVPHGDVNVIVRAGAHGQPLVEISDNGPGIGYADRERVFQPFFTTKPLGTSTGLGLPIADAILRSLGGTVQLESAPGAGTIALVQLPVAPHAERHATIPVRATIRVSPAPAPKMFTAPPPSSRRNASNTNAAARILVIDDEPALGIALGRVLRGQYDVVIESSSRAALARIDSGEMFDVLLCDLNMPELSGIDLYACLHERAPHLAPRVIFVTAGVTAPGAQAFLDALPNPVIEKPFAPDDLRTQVAKMLAPRTVVA